MTFLRRLFGGRSDPDDAGTDESPITEQRAGVAAWIRLGDREFTNEREQQKVFDLENRVIRVVEAAHAGTYDTNDLVPGFFAMRLLTNDAEPLIALLRETLRDVPIGSYLTVRREPGGSEERVELEEVVTGHG
jgi:hypothetical protein